MAVKRLNHAVLYVRNVERSVTFYQEALGFTVAMQLPGAAFLQVPGSHNDHDLGLFEVGAGAGPNPAGKGTVGLYHLAWEVETLGELQEVRARLEAMGSLAGASDHATTKALYAHDPDGIEFEVSWLVPADRLGDIAPEARAAVRPLDLDTEIRRYGADTRGLETVAYEHPVGLPVVAKTFVVRTYGCQMNEHDSERIAGLLEADGMQAVDDVADADVVVLNTCCIRENADNKLYGNLGHLKSVKDARPGMQIMVAGCLAQKDREQIQARAPHVDVVFGTHNVHRAAELLAESTERGPLMEILEATVASDHDAFPSALPARREVPYAAWLTIQIGCDNSCAFCIVPSVRGEEISRPFDAIVAEAEQLAADGVTELTLLGQNVNSYGRDITRRRPLFAELLRAVGGVDGIRRVRFTSPHPKDLRPETIDAMATTPAVCPHLHLPLQAGSDRVLAAMHRGYTAERYLAKLAAARAAIDDLAVTTDLIVGFPGETDDDFERTLEVVAEASYDSAYTFIFSPRPGTEAAERVADFVPADVVAERFERLRIVVERSALAKHEARVGRVEEVLVEGPSKRDPSVLTGRTAQAKLVHFSSEQPLRPGSYADVAITRAAPHHLAGTFVGATHAARHRTRIPVAIA